MTKKDTKDKDGDESRDSWGGRLDFLMTALSFAVGMGNLWRFPYLCYKNGGGAFLIPYLIMVFFIGVPMIFLEMALGQYGRQGVVSIWKCVPLFQGIGWMMFFVSFITCTYYNMLVAYSFLYTFVSFASDVPWRHCDNEWNTIACKVNRESNLSHSCGVNETLVNGTCQAAYGILGTASSIKPKSPSDEYFHHYILGISDGLHDLGTLQWKLAGCLLLCWILVVFGLMFGVKSLGKATYVTSMLPFVILIILFIRSLMLEGSGAGVLFYLTPDIGRLASAEVWADAATQVCFSMSCCWGGLITLASFNKFNNNCFLDALVVAAGDFVVSIFGGVVIFAIIGYMAHELQVPIESVVTSGPGLAFIVYPEVVATLPLSPLWSILFMLMLVNLGIGTQFTFVTTAHTTLLEVFSDTLRQGRRPTILLVVMCVFCFLIGLIFCSQGGMYVLQIVDTYVPSYPLLFIGLMECIAIGWFYGASRFLTNIEHMLGYRPTRLWSVCWMFITPCLILFILIFKLSDFEGSKYGTYHFPLHADVIGWMMSLLLALIVPLTAIVNFMKSNETGTIIEQLRYLTKSTSDWGPVIKSTRETEHLNSTDRREDEFEMHRNGETATCRV